MDIREELDQFFNTSFPNQIQQAMIKCTIHSYAIAYEKCKAYPEEEGHDLLGFLRWIELRSQLRGLGGRFNEIETYAAPNGKASSYHVVIDSDKMILTVSSVPAPSILPRPASYRLEYCINNQTDLFEQEPKHPTKIYGILIHGSTSKDRSKPDFIQVRFPDRDYGKYWPYKIDLFERHYELASDLLGTRREIAQPLLIPEVIIKDKE